MANTVEFLFKLMFQNSVLVSVDNIQAQSSLLSCASFCTDPCDAFFYDKERHQCYLSTTNNQTSDQSLKFEEAWIRFGRSRVSTPCYPGYRELSSVEMCVKFVTKAKTYGDARADCEAVPGGRMIHLQTSAKIAAIDAIHRAEYAGNGFYIGLNDDPNNNPRIFRWTDGTPVTDTNWAKEQPNHNQKDYCVVIDSIDYKWFDIFCTDVIPYICEIVP